MLPRPLVVFALGIQLAVIAMGYPEYASRIPNGRNVRKDGQFVDGVGHVRFGGGGPRNQFGNDLQSAGFRWTRDLCKKDSDCDGLTNGEELGDPDCIWRFGQSPRFTAGITHPGVPNSQRALADTCTGNNWSRAEVFPSRTDVTLTLPSYPVPTDATTYAKYAFEFPFPSGGSSSSSTWDVSDDAFIVKFEPVIRNVEVVHHMILYACDVPLNDSKLDAIRDAPSVEGEMPCSEFLTAWAVGAPAFCFPKDVGIRIARGDATLALEVHYDNPNSISGIVDSSGFRLSVVADDGSAAANAIQEGAFMTVGSSFVKFDEDDPLPPNPYYGFNTSNNDSLYIYGVSGPQTSSGGDIAAAGGIYIPEGYEKWAIEVDCEFPALPADGINVFAYALHSHQLGRSMITSLTRQGSASPDFDIGCNTEYDFDLQEMTPVAGGETFKIYPTDQIRLTCVYDSRGRSDVTIGGDPTTLEMCFNFLLYYPKQPDAGAGLGLDQYTGRTAICFDGPRGYDASGTPAANHQCRNYGEDQLNLQCNGADQAAVSTYTAAMALGAVAILAFASA